MFGQIFWIWDVFRLEFRGLLEDLWGDVCRICGGVLIPFSYGVGGLFGRILEEFWIVCLFDFFRLEFFHDIHIVTFSLPIVLARTNKTKTQLQ